MDLSLCSRANQDDIFFVLPEHQILTNVAIRGLLVCCLAYSKGLIWEGGLDISTLVMAKTSDSTEDTVPCRGCSVTLTCIHT